MARARGHGTDLERAARSPTTAVIGIRRQAPHLAAGNPCPTEVGPPWSRPRGSTRPRRSSWADRRWSAALPADVARPETTAPSPTRQAPTAPGAGASDRRPWRSGRRPPDSWATTLVCGATARPAGGGPPTASWKAPRGSGAHRDQRREPRHRAAAPPVETAMLTTGSEPSGLHAVIDRPCPCPHGRAPARGGVRMRAASPIVGKPGVPGGRRSRTTRVRVQRAEGAASSGTTTRPRVANRGRARTGPMHPITRPAVFVDRHPGSGDYPATAALTGSADLLPGGPVWAKSPAHSSDQTATRHARATPPRDRDTPLCAAPGACSPSGNLRSPRIPWRCPGLSSPAHRHPAGRAAVRYKT